MVDERLDLFEAVVLDETLVVDENACVGVLPCQFDGHALVPLCRAEGCIRLFVACQLIT